MKELVEIRGAKAVTTSIKVAKYFGKEHDVVLKEISELDCTDKFKSDNFVRTKGYYTMTKDGFTFLVMGYKGKKASRFKEEYIKAFNLMEALAINKQTAEYRQARIEEKAVSKKQMDNLKNSCVGIKPFQYMKANTIADKAVSLKFGYPKMIKKNDMTSDMLKERGVILEQTTALMIAKNLGVDIESISNVIYNHIRTH
jgi:Rha family phage regulatory protein